jgi:hypothetical protein
MQYGDLDLTLSNICLAILLRVAIRMGCVLYDLTIVRLIYRLVNPQQNVGNGEVDGEVNFILN